MYPTTVLSSADTSGPSSGPSVLVKAGEKRQPSHDSTKQNTSTSYSRDGKKVVKSKHKKQKPSIDGGDPNVTSSDMHAGHSVADESYSQDQILNPVSFKRESNNRSSNQAIDYMRLTE